MYKYKCSKQECGSTWTLNEGNLNGFVLTCPICGKGRGVFVEQTKRQLSLNINDGIEEMTITAGEDIIKSTEELSRRVDAFVKKNSLKLAEKNMSAAGRELACTFTYNKLTKG